MLRPEPWASLTTMWVAPADKAPSMAALASSVMMTRK
jgi:hypothetical protein